MLAAVPSLEELLADPRRLDNLDQAALAALALKAASVTTLITARMNLMASTNAAPESEGDRLVSIEEAAERLCMTRDYLYRNRDKLGFAVKTGPGQLRFSLKGIERYLRSRALKPASLK